MFSMLENCTIVSSDKGEKRTLIETLNVNMNKGAILESIEVDERGIYKAILYMPDDSKDKCGPSNIADVRTKKY